MNTTTKILGINLAVLLLYSLLSLAISSVESQAGMSFGLLLMMAVPFHAVINLILAVIFFIRKNNAAGLACLISVGGIGLIGFSVCLGGVAALGG